ncbi:MAG: hypothetical protein B5M52_05100 [Helicobacteraceae bacterium 4484_230]|nr:MAG: hypothetical protein B5M52_05100 [Helicobacteraceae bacterium 4484_230]
MRIDKYLNAVNITKRRAVAQDMIASGVVSVNGKAVKASKNIDVGDIIAIAYLKGEKRYEVLQIPQTKSTPKSKQHEFVKELA